MIGPYGEIRPNELLVCMCHQCVWAIAGLVECHAAMAGSVENLIVSRYDEVTAVATCFDKCLPMVMMCCPDLTFAIGSRLARLRGDWHWRFLSP